ncbi:uncharacterized protein LOC124450678 [Xenia sp. Carnegie-2017]|uniref:uncharacterized protein LOC124450678 n=1 Tax=Xenia sp. Carnegie-2017 TaxID=2897299 RepID=UPI001F03D475|nr:uncharacterized protein LOC124450678 [Xenia sp. Carnegie-2017]
MTFLLRSILVIVFIGKDDLQKFRQNCAKHFHQKLIMSADDDVDNVDQQELDSVLCTEQGNMFELQPIVEIHIPLGSYSGSTASRTNDLSLNRDSKYQYAVLLKC